MKATMIGAIINFMAEHNDIEGVKEVIRTCGYTLDELHQKCPFLDIGYLLVLRKGGDI